MDEDEMVEDEAEEEKHEKHVGLAHCGTLQCTGTGNTLSEDKGVISACFDAMPRYITWLNLLTGRLWTWVHREIVVH